MLEKGELRGKTLWKEGEERTEIQRAVWTTLPARVINEMVKQLELLHGGSSRRKFI